MAILTYDQIANLEILQQFYFLVWRLFGVNIAIASPDLQRSSALEAMERWSPFCVQLRKLGGEDLCRKCDQIHWAIVGQQRKSFRYLCWAGLREFIVPIMLDGEILAYIQCGQVLDTTPSENDWYNTRRNLLSYGLQHLPPEEAFFSLKVILPEDQKDLITLLELFSNYIAYAQYQILLSELSKQSQIEERALAFIRNHFTDPISLDDVAQAASTSKRNITRIFRDNIGKTVLETIHDLRIMEACRLLQANEMPISKIAFEAGFGSLQQFNRVFIKLRQCTPRDYQKLYYDTKNPS